MKKFASLILIFILTIIVLVSAVTTVSAQTCSGSVSQTWTVYTCEKNLDFNQYFCAASQQSATFACSWSNIGGSTQCLHEGKPNWTCSVSADGQTCNSGQDPTYPSSSGCNVYYPPPPPPPPPPTPDCNDTIVCSGSCQPLTANSCSTNNSSKSGCVYTTYSPSGGTCNQVPAPDQPCTLNNCDTGYTCFNGNCQPNSSPPPGSCTVTSCNANPPPACGQVAPGTDNCGNSCTAVGPTCPPPAPASCASVCPSTNYACQTNLGNVAGCPSSCQGVYGTQCDPSLTCNSSIHQCVPRGGGGGGGSSGSCVTGSQNGANQSCRGGKTCCGGYTCQVDDGRCTAPASGGGNVGACPSGGGSACCVSSGRQDGCPCTPGQGECGYSWCTPNAGGVNTCGGLVCNIGQYVWGSAYCPLPSVPPAAPVQVCHPTSGISDDLCNADSSRDYLARLSAQNVGPSNSDEPHLHRYTLINNQNGIPITSTWLSETQNNINQIYSYPASQITPLTTANYSWNTQAYSSSGKTSPVSGWWSFNFTYLSPCLQTSGDVHSNTGINAGCKR